MRFKTRFAAAATLALLAGGARAQTTAPAAPIASSPAPTAPATASVPADPALWVVKDKDTTVYLFGTVHALKPRLSWFDSAVKTAFDSSGQLVLEIPLPSDEDARAVILPLALDTSGKTLTSKLSETDRVAYAAAMTKLGLPPTALDQLKPWFAAITMAQISLQKAGYDPNQGAEKALDAAAKAGGKPVTGLETLRQQLGFFDTLPEKDQIAFLMSGVRDLDKFGEIIDAMVERWKAGDAPGLGELMNRDVASQPVLYKVLLADRNARWADWIDTRMKTPGTVFIAVGAGHLAGGDSVQAQLARHHLKAVRVKY